MKKLLIITLLLLVGCVRQPQLGATFAKQLTEDNTRLIITKNNNVLLDLKLTSSHLMVPAGNDVRIAELRLIDWGSIDKLFDGLKFIDREDIKELSKTARFKYAEKKTVKKCDPPDYEKCYDIQVPDWDKAVEFSSLSELPYKDIDVGIYTDTFIDEKVDWIPTIEGFEIKEWAEYDVTELDSEAVATEGYLYNRPLRIDDTHFVFLYAGAGNDGFLETY